MVLSRETYKILATVLIHRRSQTTYSNFDPCNRSSPWNFAESFIRDLMVHTGLRRISYCRMTSAGAIRSDLSLLNFDFWLQAIRNREAVSFKFGENPTVRAS
ncbi:hypothetical protein Pdw03_0352 [Penicillium digitatum]|uniref:Uncharacterized protein n=1 Tax=Penicillium digitatum TaxID=36651 RepID=A0A7T7BMP8_PENDI|nr:hypothetical protein Pdw03_0352 [Penicillium digitatum]